MCVCVRERERERERSNLFQGKSFVSFAFSLGFVCQLPMQMQKTLWIFCCPKNAGCCVMDTVCRGHRRVGVSHCTRHGSEYHPPPTITKRGKLFWKKEGDDRRTDDGPSKNLLEKNISSYVILQYKLVQLNYYTNL